MNPLATRFRASPITENFSVFQQNILPRDEYKATLRQYNVMQRLHPRPGDHINCNRGAAF
jgi:hypothetical protein